MVSFLLGVKVWSRKDVKAATFCNANNYYFYLSKIKHNLLLIRFLML